MTPKEKADELFNTFNKKALQPLCKVNNIFERKQIIKDSCLICVQEVLNANPHANPLNTDGYSTLCY